MYNDRRDCAIWRTRMLLWSTVTSIINNDRIVTALYDVPECCWQLWRSQRIRLPDCSGMGTSGITVSRTRSWSEQVWITLSCRTQNHSSIGWTISQRRRWRTHTHAHARARARTQWTINQKNKRFGTMHHKQKSHIHTHAHTRAHAGAFIHAYTFARAYTQAHLHTGVRAKE